MAPSPSARIVVIGAGFGGLAAARTLAQADPNLQITIVDRRNHHLFQALLYQVASAGLNAGEIASPVRGLFHGCTNVKVLMAEFSGFDRQQVILDGGQTLLAYDTLVLSIGVRTSYFGNHQWAQWAPGMKSLGQALSLRRRVLTGFELAEKEHNEERRRFLTTIVVVGGGPTGVELSGAFAELRRNVLGAEFSNIRASAARVVLIEGGPRVLAAFPEKLSLAAQDDLRQLGVELRLGERVQDIGDGFLRTDKAEIHAHTMVWAAGVEGYPLARQWGLACDRGGRLLVDPDLRLPGYDNVYCIGDMAHCKASDGKPLPGMAPVAMQQGSHVARNILLQRQGRVPEPFSYRDPGIMATVGRSRGVAYLNGRLYTGWRGWLTWLYHHLLRIVDLENRVLVVLRWTWAYAAWRWGVRLIVVENEENEEPDRIPK